MSWQLGAFALLAGGLAGGFAWYERSRPPSRLVGLVAALAALAIAGRLAFAAIPNVKPTTDIVLISGYALGAAPGFVVGALAALVSNFIFGQGPWTPWQMAGWGMVGVLGAALAAARGRGYQLGRWPLAAACGLAGLAYGALQNLSLMVTYGGEQSLDRFLALSAAAIPFDVAHAAGNVAFALLAGPALVGMLLRFRTRSEVRWLPSPAPAATALLALAAIVPALAWGSPATPAHTSAGGAAAAARYLERAQNRDGGFGAAPGQRSSPLFTGWAVLGLEAAGRDPARVRRAGRSPLAYLRRRARRLRDTADVERTALALAGAGLRPGRLLGADPARTLLRGRRRDGSLEGKVNLTAYAVLTWKATRRGRRTMRPSVRWLLRAQNPDGGWGVFAQGTPSDCDSTGAVLEALAAAGRRRSRAVRRGVAFLRRAQRPGGGFGQYRLDAPNSQSTALAVQGLIAAGRSPARVRRAGRSPLAYLAARQARDGHYRYSAASDQTPVWVTAQALLAVRGRTLPLARSLGALYSSLD